MWRWVRNIVLSCALPAALVMASATVVFATNPNYLHFNAYGSYESSTYLSSNTSCDGHSTNWSHSLAFKFTWSSPAAGDLYWYYIDFYGGSVSYDPGDGWFFGLVYLYDLAGEQSTQLTGMSSHSFLSSDLTVWLNAYKAFNSAVVWEAPVNGWSNQGPLWSCGFTPTVEWLTP